MGKSSQIVKIKHLNVAIVILKESKSLSQAAVTLTQKLNLSKRQAYRYLSEAAQHERVLPVPAPKVTFTVKLPVDLLETFRKSAQVSQCSLSQLTAQAIKAYLSRGHGG